MLTDTRPTLMAIYSAADAGVPLGHPAPDLISVPLDQIVPCRWQPRQQFDPAALLDLANDIGTHGVLTPPLVWRNEDGEYELIAGERRIRACYALALVAIGRTTPLEKAVQYVAENGFTKIHPEVKEKIASASIVHCPSSIVHCREVWGKPAQLHELALVDNLQRADLSPLEEARALHDLIQEYAYTQRQLAERLGKSQTWISQRLTLLNLAPAVADQVVASEVDAATAREIARLAPAVQPAAVKYLRDHAMKSKAAQAFVQQVLDLSDPQHYADEAAAQSPWRRLTQIALAQIPDEGARQQAIVAYAGMANDGKLQDPKGLGDHRYKDLLIQTGIAGVGKTRYDIELTPLWNAHAPTGGHTCAACQLNPHRELVGEINALVKANRDGHRFSDAGWPRCAPDLATCPSYAAPEAALRLPLPWLSSDFAFTPDEEAAFDDSGPYRRITDVGHWAAIIRRHYAQAATAALQKEAKAANGLANALARYLSLQRSGDLVTDHIHHQPCSLCAFHKGDADDPAAHCHWQQQPPDWSDYDTILIRLWESGNTTIGRCRLFRLKQPELNLHDWGGAGIHLVPDGLIHLLWRASARDGYNSGPRYGPHWFDCKRTKSWEPPSWSNCQPALARLIPQLSPGQQLSLLMLWEDPFTWSGLGYSQKTIEINAYVPRLGRIAPFELKETITRA